MKKVLVKYRAELIGAAVGIIAGWLYWFFIGCSSGSCAITSNPYNSMIYGMVMGILVAGLGKPGTDEKKENKL